MSQQKLLIQVADILHGLGIEFMLTGSHASSLQGEPRSTHDIDLVVNMDASAVPALVTAFQSDQFYLSAEATAEAVRSRRMFSILDVTSGEKIDFWMLTNTPFDSSRFARRRRMEIDSRQIDISAPEDTILMKLFWCQKSGGSEKQFNDVRRVYELQREVLDQSYLDSWARKLGVEELWQRVGNEIGQ